MRPGPEFCANANCTYFWLGVVGNLTFFLRQRGEASKVKSTAKSREGSATQSGFTVAELLIVLTIILIVVGLSIPSFSRTIDNSRLKAATQKLAAMYQDSRLRATQDDATYGVLVSAPTVTPAMTCIDLDGNGACGGTEPTTTFGGKIKVSNVGVPVPLGPQLSFQANTTEAPALGATLIWNARGLPCQRSSATSACVATGWVQHLQYRRANGEILYGAVSVSPTGRVKTWTYISSGNGNGQWL